MLHKNLGVNQLFNNIQVAVLIAKFNLIENKENIKFQTSI